MPRKGDGELKRYIGIRVTQAEKDFLQKDFDNVSHALRVMIEKLRAERDGG